jgi:transposase-like protein
MAKVSLNSSAKLAKNNINENKRKRSFTIAFKRAALKHYELSKSKRKTAKNLGILRTALIKWVHQKEIIQGKKQKLGNRRLTKDNTLNRSKFAASEDRVYEWFKNQRANQVGILISDIQQKILDDLRATNQSELTQTFKASYGWARRFMNRFNLTIRRISGSGKGKKIILAD